MRRLATLRPSVLLAVAFCAMALLVSSTASAQLYSDEAHSTWHRHARSDDASTEQTMAFEVRIGPYRPNIDDEFGGDAQPYHDVFGDDTRVFIGLELDYQLVRIPYVGTLGPGAGWAYTSMSANARLVSSGEESSEETSLWIMPMYAAAVLRADVFAREFGVPLVPYFKLGMGFGFWKSSDGVGTSKFTMPDGSEVEAKGHSWGLHVAPGLMLQLDRFDRHASQELDNSVGINHSYAFVEWMWSDLGGLGGGDQMKIGTSTWVTGLAFEM